MERSRIRTRNVIILILIFIIGIIIGFIVGSYITIKAVTNIASRFIDKDLVEQAIYQYQNNIGNCYPVINLTK